MKKKEKSKIKKNLTIIIIVGLAITLASTLGILRISIYSETNYTEEATPIPNFNQITSNTTFESLKENQQKAVILFESNWCGSCLVMKDQIKKFAIDNPDTVFFTADIESFRDSSRSYEVAITPALVLIEKGGFSTIQEIRPENLQSTLEEFVLLGI